MGKQQRAQSQRADRAQATQTADSPLVVAGLLGSSELDHLTVNPADVGRDRENRRRRRLALLALVLAVPAAWLWYKIGMGTPVEWSQLRLPSVDPITAMVVLFFGVMIFTLVGTSFVAGRSPHVMYRPEQMDVHFSDLRGVDLVKDDVRRSLAMFLAHKTYADTMGGQPRRGLLFEGLPGTGKTMMAKAMAAEAGVPFLYVSATSFQSMYYGATARKIRSFFKALRKTARREGGAIGFIEEIDAIAMSRGGMPMTAAPMTSAAAAAHREVRCGGMTVLPSAYAELPATHADALTANRSMTSEGTGGVVNELLVQLQSFDEPTGWQKWATGMVDVLNGFLPVGRQLPRPRVARPNVLIIAATNRADQLDPALVRPGRFDRRLTFEPPTKAGRRDLIDYVLATRAHGADLDEALTRDQIAAVTTGYTPAMLEHLFDEALVNAMRRGSDRMSAADVTAARLVEEVGLGQPVAYTEHEKRLIATHEAGHATIAYLVAPERRLEILTIVKRREALGMLAHGDREDVFTRSRSEMTRLIQIAMGGLVAEELFFGDVSTGPGGDLLYATNVAAQMMGACGMGDSLISLQAVERGALADSNITGRVLGDPQGRLAVEDLLQAQKRVATELMAANRHLVEGLRDALLERHELIGEEIVEVLRTAQARHDAVAAE